MVGLPAMRRGSFALVTRPSTVAPMGITVLPSITTGSVTRAENGSPAFELKVASVVSSFILTAVPVGRADCDQAKLAIRMSEVSKSAFFSCKSYLPQFRHFTEIPETREIRYLVTLVVQGFLALVKKLAPYLTKV